MNRNIKKALLIDAIKSENLAEVRDMVRENPWLVHVELEGSTALILAIKTKNSRLVQLMIDAGASVNQPIPRGGEMPLMYAITHGSTNIIDKLLKEDANVNARNDKTGLTALEKAKQKRLNTIANMLRNYNVSDTRLLPLDIPMAPRTMRVVDVHHAHELLNGHYYIMTLRKRRVGPLQLNGFSDRGMYFRFTYLDSRNTQQVLPVHANQYGQFFLSGTAHGAPPSLVTMHLALDDRLASEISESSNTGRIRHLARNLKRKRNIEKAPGRRGATF
jgi:hypothetical protein